MLKNELENELEELLISKNSIDSKINEIQSKLKKISNEQQKIIMKQHEEMINNLKISSGYTNKSSGYTNKMIKIPVLVSGTDHDTGYCSGNDGDELEEEESYLIMSTDYLIEIDSKNYNYTNLADNLFDNEGIYKGQNLFYMRIKQCSSSGSGYCYCYTSYEGKGEISWLKNEPLICEIKYPELKHVYKSY